MRTTKLLVATLFCTASLGLAGCPQTTNPDASPDTAVADTNANDVVVLDVPADDRPPVDTGFDAGNPDTGIDAPMMADVVDSAVDDIPPYDAVIDSMFDAPLPDSFTTPEGGTVCNMTVNDGSDVTLVAVRGTPPTARGGTITPGHYVLTAAELYAPFSPGGMLNSAIDLTGTYFMLTGNAGMGDQRTSATYTVEGTTLHVMPICPAGMSTDFQFTTSATTFQMQYSVMGFSIVLTYTLR